MVKWDEGITPITSRGSFGTAGWEESRVAHMCELQTASCSFIVNRLELCWHRSMSSRHLVRISDSWVMFYAEFCQLMQGAFENYARQAALLRRQKSITATTVEQTVVDRSKMRQSMMTTSLPHFWTALICEKCCFDLQQCYIAKNGLCDMVLTLKDEI